VRRAVWLVLVAILSVQFGAAVAKNLFDEVTPTTMSWLRLASSSVILLAIARPRLRGRSREDWLVVSGYALSLGTMNWAIYQSFARIPLGVAVTIEFIGPLTLAVLGSRKARDFWWAALAGLGVALLGLEPGDITVAGVAFALLAAAAWATYILMSARTGRTWAGLDGLAVANALCALLLTAPALYDDPHVLSDGRILAIGASVGLLSSVIPYSCELTALRTIPPRLFGILMSLEPAAAALAAALVLRELLSPVQLIAMSCVIAASIGATRGIAEPVAP
jgi:inner membrane transporter RhtA